MRLPDNLFNEINLLNYQYIKDRQLLKRKEIKAYNHKAWNLREA